MANKFRPSVEKVAMVQDKPSIPDQFKLIRLLELIGNDRAFTVISRGGSVTRPSWVIHFEGDVGPTTITFDSKKPEIK